MSSTNNVVVAIADLGLGNLHSVERAVSHASCSLGLGEPVLSRDPEVLARAAFLVVPGQGGFRDGVAALDHNGGVMRQMLLGRIAAELPYIGICLGLQLLFESSDESLGAKGLGVLRGHIARIPDAMVDPEDPSRKLKVPHMGWNHVHAVGSPDRTSIVPEGYYYFVHSYHAEPIDQSLVAGQCHHGLFAITAAIATKQVVATQFHPEKSQAAGLHLLKSLLQS